MGFVEGLADAPGGVNDTVKQAQAALAEAMAAAASAQSDAARFVTENGADVISGHADVGEVTNADRGRDPDYFGPDASDA
jgi:hypothetical protein